MKSPLTIIGSNPTKESIIEILSEEWPLSAKRIHKRLAKNYNSKISYQATHKSLKELTQNKILEKINQEYLLNKEWVENLGEVSKKIKSGFEEPNKKTEIIKVKRLFFHNHYEFIKFNIALLEEIIKKDGKIDVVYYLRYVLYPHLISRFGLKRLKQLMKTKKAKIKIISRNKTPIDKWSAKQLKKIGINVEFDEKISANIRAIMNDYVIESYSSKKAMKVWDKASFTKNINEFNASSILEISLDNRYKVIAIVVKDKEIAELLRR